HWVFTDEELDSLVKKLGGGEMVSIFAEAEAADSGSAEVQEAENEETKAAKANKLNIQRYKGLGEMNPQQLWDTTMNPQTRIMKVVTIDEAQKADEIFEILMGSDVTARKRFIQTHAKSVKNLDI
ncbi:MAG TPA: DNA topoisomerase IV subunit B, partial [Candidatus Komeilibacteria bacterium]|nr:DNA topoisomerase IV subunit B [Candidatus Komeilibacteria bacterium]